MHWHTETQVSGLGTEQYTYDLTPSDDPSTRPDTNVVSAAYSAAQSLADAISAGGDAFVTLDRVRDPDTTAQSITVTVNVA